MKAVLVAPEKDRVGPALFQPPPSTGGGATLYTPPPDLPAHVIEGDPHPGYATDGDLTTHAALATHHARSHDISAGTDHTGTLGIAQIPTGTSGTSVALGNHAHAGVYEATGAVSTHAGLPDPHPGYATDGDLTSHAALATHHARAHALSDAADHSGVLGIAQVPTGTGGSQVALGNHAHSGTYDPAGTAAAAVVGLQPTSERGSTYPNLTSGKVPTAQLGGAGANATTFLRGDQSWAVPAGGAGGTPGTATTASAVGDAVSHGSATLDYAKTDHRHAREAFGSVATESVFGSTSTDGSGALVARSNHKHGSPADPIPGHIATGHTGYQAVTGKDAINGYAGLDAYGFVNDPWRTAASYPTLLNPAASITYAKILSGTFDAQYDLTAGSMLLTFVDINPATNVKAVRRGTLRWNLTQTGVSSSEPSVMLELLDASGFTADDVVLVTLSTGPVNWELYVRLTSIYEMCWVTPLAIAAKDWNQFGNMPITWHNRAALVASLPMGMQYAAMPVSATGWTNVNDFGAVGNGIANDTQAILDAVAAAYTTGRFVYFPAGTYLLDQTIELNVGRITLRGAGRGGRTANQPGYGSWISTTEIKWVGAASGKMIHVGPNSGGNAVSGVRIEDLTLNGNGLANVGVHCKGTQDGRLYIGVRRFAASGNCVWFNCFNAATDSIIGYGGNYSWDIDVLGGESNASTICWLGGSPNVAAGSQQTDDHLWNTCVNKIRVVGWYSYTTAANMLVMGDTDHNTIELVWGFPEGAGDAAVILFLRGDRAAGAAGQPRKNLVQMAMGGQAGQVMLNFQSETGGKAPHENVVQWVDFQSGQTVFVGAGAETNRWFGDATFWYGEEAPASIASGATINNWNPGYAAIVETTSLGNCVISGMYALGPGTMRWIYNANTEVSGRTITLNHNSTGSTVDRRFLLPGDANMVISPGEMISLWYSKSQQKWVALK